MSDRTKSKTPPPTEKFDAASTTDEPMLHDRRNSHDRRDRTDPAPSAKSSNPDRIQAERRTKKERRRRIDPTTFEKQYSDDEIEFMNAMQCFKMQSGRSFPTYGEVLKVAQQLGYRKAITPTPSQTVDGSTPCSEA